ncbi:MAG: putative DNA-binding domain-containing protein [Sandaracinaceae bacterium]|nr:putative DNA-binding domain-containing protein [Sandaracinaceae bacterium]
MTGPAELSLRAYQETALRVFFSREPSADDLVALGSPERFRVYRGMVRHRLDKVVRAALPRTLWSLGEDEASALITAFFDEAPPRTRWFREVPEHFGAFALARFGGSSPAHLRELCEFELARWTVQHLESEPATSVVALDFALPPVTTPALRRLRVQHRVDLRGTPPRMEPANLAVYRRLDDKPATWVLNDIAAALLDAFVEGQGSLAERVQAVTRARDVAIDASFLEKLSALLADFLERGVLLGSAQPVPTGETGD